MICRYYGGARTVLLINSVTVCIIKLVGLTPPRCVTKSVTQHIPLVHFSQNILEKKHRHLLGPETTLTSHRRYF